MFPDLYLVSLLWLQAAAWMRKELRSDTLWSIRFLSQLYGQYHAWQRMFLSESTIKNLSSSGDIFSIIAVIPIIQMQGGKVHDVYQWMIRELLCRRVQLEPKYALMLLTNTHEILTVPQ